MDSEADIIYCREESRTPVDSLDVTDHRHWKQPIEHEMDQQLLWKWQAWVSKEQFLSKVRKMLANLLGACICRCEKHIELYMSSNIKHISVNINSMSMCSECFPITNKEDFSQYLTLPRKKSDAHITMSTQLDPFVDLIYDSVWS